MSVYPLWPRQSRKGQSTADTVKWAADTGGLVVCATQAQIDRIVALAAKKGVEITTPILAAPPEPAVSVLPMVDYPLSPYGKRMAEINAEILSYHGVRRQYLGRTP